jgi:hypothetical protein
MELVGYIIAGLTALLGVIISIIARTDDKVLEARAIIKEEYCLAYKEFGEIVSSEAFNAQRFDAAIKRLSRLHIASPPDCVKIRIIERRISATVPVIILFIFLTVCSLAVGLKIDFKNETYKNIYIVLIPLILLFLELFYLGYILSRERFLKRLSINYKNLDYGHD